MPEPGDRPSQTFEQLFGRSHALGQAQRPAYWAYEPATAGTSRGIARENPRERSHRTCDSAGLLGCAGQDAVYPRLEAASRVPHIDCWRGLGIRVDDGLMPKPRDCRPPIPCEAAVRNRFNVGYPATA